MSNRTISRHGFFFALTIIIIALFLSISCKGSKAAKKPTQTSQIKVVTLSDTIFKIDTFFLEFNKSISENFTYDSCGRIESHRLIETRQEKKTSKTARQKATNTTAQPLQPAKTKPKTKEIKARKGENGGININIVKICLISFCIGMSMPKLFKLIKAITKK